MDPRPSDIKNGRNCLLSGLAGLAGLALSYLVLACCSVSQLRRSSGIHHGTPVQNPGLECVSPKLTRESLTVPEVPNPDLLRDSWGLALGKSWTSSKFSVISRRSKLVSSRAKEQRESLPSFRLKDKAWQVFA